MDDPAPRQSRGLSRYLRGGGVGEFGPAQLLFLNLGPLAALAIVSFADLTPGNRAATYVAAIAVWMAIWWMSECAPLPVTALLPLLLLPASGVLASEAVAAEYFNSTVLLFLGGFLIALAMQRWDLHKRIALNILRAAGTQPRVLLLGFMAATAFISWWVNNTATTMMMLPIALAIVLQLEAELGAPASAGFGRALLLAAAYASSIGGIATPVGTPTNLILIRQYELLFPGEPPLTFARWMALFVPLSCVLLVAAWLLLERTCGRLQGRIRPDLLAGQFRSLGPVSFEQRVVFGVFISAALLWITRAPLDFGSFSFAGWGSLFMHLSGGELRSYVDDGTVAIALGVLLFLVPSRTPGAGALMRWEDTRELPWGTILLFGGGFALAEAFFVSGLADWFGAQLRGLPELHPIVVIALIYMLITALSEFASNTASSQLVLPIVGAVAVSMGLSPLLPMLAAGTGASLDFVLPAATPPNAMVIATGRVSVAQMVRTGLQMELICLVTVTAAIWFFTAVLQW